MLNEYKDSEIWRTNTNTVSLRSDVLVSKRVIDLLGDVSNKKILDAGCGNGKVSRKLSEMGANVYAVDKIEDQISIAKQLSSKVVYFLGDLTKLDEIYLPRDFDIAISLMTFLYLDEKQFIEALLQVKKHLGNNGRFIYANIHPSRYVGQLKVEDKLPTIDGKSFKTIFYNHSLSFIEKAFTDTGFIIKSVLEPLPSKDEIEKYPVLFSQNVKEPLYIIIEATS